MHHSNDNSTIVGHPPLLLEVDETNVINGVKWQDEVVVYEEGK